MGLGPAEAPCSPTEGNTGHVSKGHESPHTRGPVQKHKKNCGEIWSTWRSGRIASEEATGETRS